MARRWSYFLSTVGLKQIVGLTGLILSLFVFMHMAGNLLIFVGPKAYNLYGHALVSNPLIVPVEMILLGAFVLHLVIALKLAIQNRLARPVGYAVTPRGEKATSPIAKTLWAQGLVILLFVILHLITFKFGAHYTVEYDGKQVRDLYRLVIEVFAIPGYVIWYAVALVVLFFHLSHGVGSMFQTWGLHQPRLQKIIKAFSWIYATVVAAGFISQPLFVYFFH